jgi:DNA polymerase I-like protein with 3'-5' exonuclease and polymerase domains
MHELPKEMEVKLEDLQDALANASCVVFDFETSSVKPREAIVAGIGFYFPLERRSFYVNVGHGLADKRIPKYDQQDVADAIAPFFGNPNKHAIAHNATYDVRMLYRMGVTVACRTTCTLILTHRLDENLRSFGPSHTIHYHLDKVTYGLKELTKVFFNQTPPSLMDVIGNKNTINSPPLEVGQYCCQDTVNTYNLFQSAERRLGITLENTTDAVALAKRKSNAVAQLLVNIDDPNNLVLSKMLWEGIRIDCEEAERQREIYQRSIQACREVIWDTLNIRWPLETPRNQIKVLRHLNLGEELDFEPFMSNPAFPNDDVSAKRSYLVEILQEILSSNLSTGQSEADKIAKGRVIAAILSMNMMKHRISAFINPLPRKSWHSGFRLYPDRFSSTLVTTRFSSSPNLQNLPGKADAADPEDELWKSLLPGECLEPQTTRNLFVAKPGHVFVSIDLKAAEPRYMACLFQKALKMNDYYFNLARERAYKRRKDLHPKLIQAMHRLQDRTRGKRFEITWPSVTTDPLWNVFKHGVPTNDPYNALLIAMDPQGHQEAVSNNRESVWLKENRWRGKRAFLAFAYGASAEMLAPGLKWPLSQTKEALRKVDDTYVTLKPLRNLTMLQMVHLGQVENLWGRPRRINGYYQLAQPKPVTIGFYRMRPSRRDYVARIIPLGATSPAPDSQGMLKGGGGVQAFVEECYVELDDGKRGEVVLAGNPDGSVSYISRSDPFATADHFNRPPFRNINFNQIQWVRDEYGLQRFLPRQGRALRAAFNSLCQSTGADHLRWIMNKVDLEVCQKPAFQDCKLVLTVHDSLVYEVPEERATSFIAAACPVISRRPSWSDIDFDIEVEVGRRFGEMKGVKIP